MESMCLYSEGCFRVAAQELDSVRDGPRAGGRRGGWLRQPTRKYKSTWERSRTAAQP